MLRGAVEKTGTSPTSVLISSSVYYGCLLCRPWRHLRAMCRGRHRVENRVGEVQARGGGGGTMVKMLLLSPRN